VYNHTLKRMTFVQNLKVHMHWINSQRGRSYKSFTILELEYSGVINSSTYTTLVNGVTFYHYYATQDIGTCVAGVIELQCTL